MLLVEMSVWYSLCGAHRQAKHWQSTCPPRPQLLLVGEWVSTLSLACIMCAGGYHCHNPNTHTHSWKGELCKVRRARPIRSLVLCSMNKTEKVPRMSLISREHTHGQKLTRGHRQTDLAHVLIHLDHTDPSVPLTPSQEDFSWLNTSEDRSVSLVVFPKDTTPVRWYPGHDLKFKFRCIFPQKDSLCTLAYGSELP